MSDYAVRFYEILYRDIFENHPMLDEKGHVIDVEFSGDTMNSFETTASRTPGAGKNKKERLPEGERPEFLREYKHKFDGR